MAISLLARGARGVRRAPRLNLQESRRVAAPKLAVAPSQRVEATKRKKVEPYRAMVQPSMHVSRRLGGGVEVLVERRSRYVEGMSAADLRVVRSIAGQMLAAEKLASRRESGRYRSSWSVEVGRESRGVSIRLVNDAPYAGYLAFGTRRLKARSVTAPAARFLAALDREWEKASRRAWHREQAMRGF